MAPDDFLKLELFRYGGRHVQVGARAGSMVGAARQCRWPAAVVRRPRSAYTLLELMLAMALTTVILGLVSMVILVHMHVADKSRNVVNEAQIARILLQRVGDDLRNAIPFTQSSTSSSSSTTSSGTTSSGSTSSGSTSSGSSTSDSTSSSASTSDSQSTLHIAGINGDAASLQMEICRRPMSSQPPTSTPTPTPSNEGVQPTRLSDLRTVTYSLGASGAIIPVGQGGSTNGAMGLYRRELDRAEFQSAMEHGTTDGPEQTAELLAAEVADLHFTYYDGLTTYDTWDSTQQGKLPTAVRVTIAIHSPRTKAMSSDAATTSSLDVNRYSMLVALPNALGSSSNTSLSTSSTASGTTSSTSSK